MHLTDSTKNKDDDQGSIYINGLKIAENHTFNCGLPQKFTDYST